MKKVIHKIFNKHKFYYSKSRSWMGAGKGDSVVKVVAYKCKCGEVKSNKTNIA